MNTAAAASSHWRAAGLMLASTVLFGFMVVAIRLAAASLHTFEIAFFRNFFGLLAALPLLFIHGPGLLRTTQFPRYLFRCLVGVTSMLCGFWAIGHLPLAQAVSLSTPRHCSSPSPQRPCWANRCAPDAGWPWRWASAACC